LDRMVFSEENYLLKQGMRTYRFVTSLGSTELIAYSVEHD